MSVPFVLASLLHRSVCAADQHASTEEHVSGDSILDGARGEVLPLSHCFGSAAVCHTDLESELRRLQSSLDNGGSLQSLS